MKKLFSKLGITDKKSFIAFIMQFFKFGIVGFANTLLYFAIYYPLVYLGVLYIAANITGFILGTLNSFYFNRKYVFKHKEGNIVKQLIRVFSTYGFTLLLSTGLLYLFVDIIRISEFIAPVIVMCFTVPTNFLLIKFWAFKVPKERNEI